MKRGRMSEQEKTLIFAAKQLGVSAENIAQQLGRSTESVEKVMGKMEAPVSEVVVTTNDTEVARLQQELDELKRMVPKKPKGVIVMTGAQSARVDDSIKSTPTEYFREDCMVRQENRKVD